jgi:hypothetical protein
MNEVAFEQVLGEPHGTFTVTTRRKLSALETRLDKADAEYEVDVHTIGGEFDTALVRVSDDDLRHIKMLIQP